MQTKDIGLTTGELKDFDLDFVVRCEYTDFLLGILWEDTYPLLRRMKKDWDTKKEKDITSFDKEIKNYIMNNPDLSMIKFLEFIEKPWGFRFILNDIKFQLIQLGDTTYFYKLKKQ